MKRLKGSFTVEAVILVPLLILITMIFVFFTIYIYDRAILIQDVNSLSVYARSIKDYSKMQKACEESFDEIKKEHPYLSMENLTLKVGKKGLKRTISVSGDWKLPICKVFNQKLSYEKELDMVDPISVMYTTEIVKGFID